MFESLNGLNVLISGASSGIGRETARALSRAGANVAVVARREDRLRDLESELARPGVSVVALPGDLTDAPTVQRIVDDAASQLGSIDVVVNNAGYLQIGPSDRSYVDDWDKMIDVNLRAHLYLVRYSLPYLLDSAKSSARRVADLVLLGSVSGRRGNNGSSVYNMTKWGVTGLGESLRQEFAHRDVRVSLVEPGVVATELPQSIRAEWNEDPDPAYSGFTPLDATDIADSIAYIVSRPRHVAINELLIRPTNQVA